MKIVCGAFAFFLGSSLLFGDVVQLKSGEKVQGNILMTTADEVIVEINISPTIKDERKIPRSQIARIDTQGPDELAYDKIKDLVPADTILDPSYYDEVLRSKLDPFLSDYAYSRRVTEVRKTREAFLADKARMEKTQEVRFEGAWLNKAQYEKDRYQIDARALLERMQTAAAKDEYPLILNLYERMKQDYPKASSFPDAVVLAKDSLNTLDKMTSALLVKLDYDDKKREQQLIISTAAEQQQVRQALANQKVATDAAVEQSRKTGVKYIGLYPASRDALAALHDTVVAGKTEIAAVPLDNMLASLQLARDAQKSMNNLDLKVAENDLSEATSLWPENALIITMQERLVQRKQEMEKSNKAQQDAVKRAAP
ncbi:MAG: PTPDL family protein [Chthoniobacterales bacterium]